MTGDLRQAGATVGRATPDPILTEVIRHGLDGAADAMRVALRRMAFSPIIYEITDFAAGLYDSQVRLLAQAKALPAFLGTLSFTIESSIARIGVDSLEEGDVIFSTDGYEIGSHQQDATVIVPGFWRGQLVGYAGVKAHHLDIGAKDPYCTDTVDIFQEGTIFPSVRIYRAGALQEDLYRTVLANSRLPTALEGDLKAQIAAAKLGLEGLYRLLDRFGLDVLSACVERMFDHGETVVREFFAELPDGRYVGRTVMDNNGVTENRVPVDVAVEVSGSDVTVDLTGSPPLQAGPINCPYATTASAVRIAIMSLAGGAESANEGFFRPITLRTTPGTMVHATSPAPIFMFGWAAMAVIDAIYDALAQALPERVPAANGGDVCGFIVWGRNDDGSYWGDGWDHSVGHGASALGDQRGPLMHIGVSGIQTPSIEVLESRRPLLAERAEYAVDSGGTGQYRGGAGVDFHYRALADFSVTIPWDRTLSSPGGLAGGGAARPNRFVLQYPDGTQVERGKVTALHVSEGTLLRAETGGGGGWGDPRQRDATLVRRDLREGIISEARARRDYPHAFTGADLQS
jgi:N-methylhydantoinase B